MRESFRHEDTVVEASRVERVLHSGEHHVVGTVEQDSDRLVGFCASFATRSGTSLHWEIDLLGVISAARGNGIAPWLVQDSVSEGLRRGATVARALVRRDNHAARAVFSGLQFAESKPQTLWVAEPNGVSMTIEAVRADCIPVSTLTYDGIWVEDPRDASALEQARGLTQNLSQVIGAVLPVKSEAETWAEHAGYHRVGAYNWWTRDL
ncbi:MAG: GNAT family N-acetyltransferase [Chloroflexi bacterium]|nr:GNAT family N-acetyltransferase [Chloroflexota bacterium]